MFSSEFFLTSNSKWHKISTLRLGKTQAVGMAASTRESSILKPILNPKHQLKEEAIARAAIVQLLIREASQLCAPADKRPSESVS